MVKRKLTSKQKTKIMDAFPKEYRGTAIGREVTLRRLSKKTRIPVYRIKSFIMQQMRAGNVYQASRTKYGKV